MTRDEILDLVINNMKLNVDDLEDTEIDPTKAMADYGASSLDIVEIVNTTLRKLKVKLPRTELAQLKNINDLVDLLVNTAS
ncbi:MAG: acyl carrier protein [Spirulina sp. SIO3F2]|nr:acyl carrier protein [Spirulina sp. SIO3F2]